METHLEKTNGTVEYIVEAIQGRFAENDMQTETKRFNSGDVLSDRHLAIIAAKYYEKVDFKLKDVDDPSFAYDTPTLIHNLNSGSVVVYFKDDRGDEYQIYGPEIHEDLTGLAIEAKYYLKKGLVKEKELITILQNQLEADVQGGETPYFIVDPSTEIELPEFNYDVIKVLPNDLELLLESHRLKNEESQEIDDLEQDEDDDEDEDDEDED